MRGGALDGGPTHVWGRDGAEGGSIRGWVGPGPSAKGRRTRSRLGSGPGARPRTLDGWIHSRLGRGGGPGLRVGRPLDGRSRSRLGSGRGRRPGEGRLDRRTPAAGDERRGRDQDSRGTGGRQVQPAGEEAKGRAGPRPRPRADGSTSEGSGRARRKSLWGEVFRAKGGGRTSGARGRRPWPEPRGRSRRRDGPRARRRTTAGAPEESPDSPAKTRVSRVALRARVRVSGRPDLYEAHRSRKGRETKNFLHYCRPPPLQLKKKMALFCVSTEPTKTA